MQVSVVMPLYNKAEYVRETVESILNQTYRDFEFVIIDDYSTDGSLEIIKEFKDSRIKLIQLEKNMGVSYAANIGIKAASGKYIIRTDSDDLSYPNRIERLVNYSDTHNIDVVGSNFEIHGSGEIPAGAYRFMNYSNSVIKNEDIIDDFTIVPTVHGATICVKKSTFEEGFYYDNALETGEDYELLARMIINNKKVTKIPEILYKYRFVNGSLGKGIKSTLVNIQVKLNFIYKYFKLENRGVKKFYIWGTKEFAGYLEEELRKEKYDAEVLGFTDLDNNTWGKIKNELPIISPYDMVTSLDDNTIVLTMWNIEREEIVRFLNKNGLIKNYNYFILS